MLLLYTASFLKTASSAPDLEWTWNSKSAILPRRNIALPSSAQYPVKTSKITSKNNLVTE